MILDLTVVVTRHDQPPDELRAHLADRVSALIGHSGVGKSTLVNELVPDADRTHRRRQFRGQGHDTRP